VVALDQEEKSAQMCKFLWKGDRSRFWRAVPPASERVESRQRKFREDAMTRIEHMRKAMYSGEQSHLISKEGKMKDPQGGAENAFPGSAHRNREDV